MYLQNNEHDHDKEPVMNRHGKIIPESDWEYFRKHPDKNCPCGSKIQYRYCHGKENRNEIILHPKS